MNNIPPTVTVKRAAKSLTIIDHRWLPQHIHRDGTRNCTALVLHAELNYRCRKSKTWRVDYQALGKLLLRRRKSVWQLLSELEAKKIIAIKTLRYGGHRGSETWVRMI